MRKLIIGLLTAAAAVACVAAPRHGEGLHYRAVVERL